MKDHFNLRIVRHDGSETQKVVSGSLAVAIGRAGDIYCDDDTITMIEVRDIEKDEHGIVFPVLVSIVNRKL